MMRRRRFLNVLAAGTVGSVVRASGDQQRGGRDAALASGRTWLARLPKVELHVHLEGAMPRMVLWQLITKYGGDPTVRTADDLERRFAQTPFFVAWDRSRRFAARASSGSDLAASSRSMPTSCSKPSTRGRERSTSGRPRTPVKQPARRACGAPSGRCASIESVTRCARSRTQRSSPTWRKSGSLWSCA
jgi:hypothetical protein